MVSTGDLHGPLPYMAAMSPIALLSVQLLGQAINANALGRSQAVCDLATGMRICGPCGYWTLYKEA